MQAFFSPKMTYHRFGRIRVVLPSLVDYYIQLFSHTASVPDLNLSR